MTMGGGFQREIRWRNLAELLLLTRVETQCLQGSGSSDRDTVGQMEFFGRSKRLAW